MVAPAYQPRDPSGTVLYQVVAEHLETFLAGLDADPTAHGLPRYVRDEFAAYLQCGILAHGFLRLGCDTCPHKMLLAFSCKKRGFCPSCASKRMAETAAHLVEQVIPWVPTRQWVVSVPIPLRYWMAASPQLMAQVHTIIRRTISQYYINQAVKQGLDRQLAQAGSVTFVQRFGSSINLHLHYHVISDRNFKRDFLRDFLAPRRRRSARGVSGCATCRAPEGRRWARSMPECRQRGTRRYRLEKSAQRRHRRLGMAQDPTACVWGISPTCGTNAP